jgi:hypothetical protein
VLKEFFFKVWARRAALTTGQQKILAAKAIFYRFFPRFLMASTFFGFVGPFLAS